MSTVGFDEPGDLVLIENSQLLGDCFDVYLVALSFSIHVQSALT